MNSLAEAFANATISDCIADTYFIPREYNVWYVGFANSIDEAIDLFLINLNKNGHVIVGEPEIVDYVYESNRNELIYIILYNSLPKLAYLEYMYEKQVDNGSKIL